ncbi:helix-turn-helix domain-containing protein [Lentisphaera profundi]|uniref:Helix-turn-helix domain-containing protein n=1 Tax=Lentisphaera profundi TaxID=1658616 RepID=A0ABY7VYI8_9BACT|nr:helix-turn-helix domain-containing protein [Lentisphaera profundi]WDE97856.1 helix-turn-helix domain-containing protein [Lentisphaera profundi]
MNKSQAFETAKNILKDHIPNLTLQKLSILESNETSNFEQFYKIKEVADKLHCSSRHVWNLIERGEVGAVKIGGITRIKHSEIERLTA